MGFTDGTYFGGIDNVILVVGGAFGWEIERLLPGKIQQGRGVLIGAGIGNAVSDFAGGLPIGIDFAAGTFIGCLVGLLALPICFAIQKAVSK